MWTGKGHAYCVTDVKQVNTVEKQFLISDMYSAVDSKSPGGCSLIKNEIVTPAKSTLWLITMIRLLLN